jgi:hypothetical protein
MSENAESSAPLEFKAPPEIPLANVAAANATGTGEAGNQRQIISTQAAVSSLPVVPLETPKANGAQTKNGSAGISGAVLGVVDRAVQAVKRRGRPPGIPHKPDCICAICDRRKNGGGNGNGGGNKSRPAALLGTPPAVVTAPGEALAVAAGEPEQVVAAINLAEYSGYGEAFLSLRWMFYDFRHFDPARDLVAQKYGPEGKDLALKYLKLPDDPEGKRTDAIRRMGIRLAADCGLPAGKSEYLEGIPALYMENKMVGTQIGELMASLRKLPNHVEEKGVVE